MDNINTVIEGEYKGNKLYNLSRDKCITQVLGYSFTPNYVDSYVVIDETNKDQYSFWKGALGVALLGGFGAIAGVRGKKRTEYLIAINWKYENKSLICIDDELYKKFMMAMF